MSVADLDNYSSPQYGGDKVNLTLTEHELAACHPIKAGGQSWRAFCPFHGSDHQRSLRVNMETGHFNCFACGAWGYTDTARQRWKDQQPKFKNPAPRTAPARPAPGRSNALPGPRPLPTSPASTTSSAAPSLRPSPATSPHLHLVTAKPPVTASRYSTADLTYLVEKYQAALPGSWGEEYLRRRNIPLDLALQYGIGYAPPGQWAHSARDWKYGRLVFPHTAPDGRVVNLYGRAVGSNEKVPKNVRHDHLQGEKAYFNGQTLGLEAARPALTLVDSRETVRLDGQTGKESPESAPVFICEGPFDALSLLASGRTNVVAIFGVNGWRWEWTRSVKELVFALDTDETGQQSWKELARQARLRGKSVGFLPLEAYGGAKDVNEAWISGALGEYFEKIRLREGKESEEVISAVVVEEIQVAAPAAIADIEDPRPDLKRDSWLWETLLHMCMENMDRELYGSLHGLRCCGACLEINQGGMLIISGGTELTTEQFGELEEYYFKNSRESLEKLLKKLSSKFRPEST